MNSPRQRADRLLVERGLFESRAKAQAAIEAGLVTARREGRAQSFGASPGRRIIYTRARRTLMFRAVASNSRQRIDHFILIRRAASVLMSAPRPADSRKCCSNVARGLSMRSMSARAICTRSLRARPEIISLDSTDIRKLSPASLDEPADLVSIDVSFISLKLMLPSALGLARRRPNWWL